MWFSDAYRFERVPELADVVSFLNASGLVGLMEIKASKAAPQLRERLVEGIVASLKALTSHTDQFLAVSSDPALLRALHQENPDIRVGFVAGAVLHSAPRIAHKLGVDIVVADEAALNEHEVRSLHHAGLTVIARGVDTPQRAHELAGWGIETVLSEHPEHFTARDLTR